MQFDPSGDAALRAAKRVRRSARREGGDEAARAEALRHFGLPATTLDHAARLPEPLYPPARAASS
jgi:hypothetical protein